MRVLIVEDDGDLADLLVRALRQVAWAADVRSTGEATLQAMAVTEYDLAVLDIGLPDIDGVTVCRRLRERGVKTPILILTARGALTDRVKGLDAGADDYLPKPFAIDELMARLRALARRPSEVLDATLQVADLEFHAATATAKRAGVSIRLTARECALLEYFLRNAGLVVTRTQILEHVWDDNFDPIGNAVDVLVARVRRKVDYPGAAELIHTVRGRGYVLSDQWPDDR